MPKTDILIKGIERSDRDRLKMEAAAHGVKMGDFFGVLVREHAERHGRTKLEDVLSWRSGRSAAELESLGKRLRKLRHSFRLERSYHASRV
jgi:hypothetical protein